MSAVLDTLLRQPGLWRAGERVRNTKQPHVPSGFAGLDAVLPGGGWPLGALTEIIHAEAGMGELSLVMPALVRLGRTGRWNALVAPPYLPYAPALAACGVDLSKLLLIHPDNETDALWAVEQALRSGVCAAVVAWPGRSDERCLRRLQLAAEAGGALGVLLRQHDGGRASPAAVRLRLERSDGETVARLLKCRGGMPGQAVPLDFTSVGSATVACDGSDGVPEHGRQACRQRLPRPDALQTVLVLDVGGPPPAS